MSLLTPEDALSRHSPGKPKGSPRSSLGEFTGWPFTSEQYTPDIENGADIKFSLEQLESEELAQNTAIKYMSTSSSSIGVHEDVLNLRDLAKTLQPDQRFSQRYYFINRFLMKSNVTRIPSDSNKLQIAPAAFRLLVSELGTPPAFVGAISRFYQPSGRGSRTLRLENDTEVRDLWYILPVRVQVGCTDTKQGHTSTTAGSNQMDPFHYLHLPDEKVDIRGSHIGIYSQHNLATHQLSVVVVSFQDGRWSRVVEEPQKRVREVLENTEHLTADQTPFSVHLIYLTTALRLWNNVFASFNNQLIAHEKSLQNQMDKLNRQGEDFNNNLNKILHAMAAHLHRYGSELGRFADIVDHIEKQFKEMGLQSDTENDVQCRTSSAIEQVKSQLKDINTFRQELEYKTQNILALLFSNIQVSNDKVMVENGQAMNKMLKASRAEAQMSMRLAEEMKKDSVAMKTIALLTVFFLPGTSFAAVLSMPFFSKNGWMSEASRVWLWVVLTVPSTALAFAFYQYWRRRHEIAITRSKDISAAEMGDMLNGAAG